MKKIFLLAAALMLAFMSVQAAKAPAKPTRDQIAKDLIGIRLNEGYTDGWFPEDWYWIVEKGEVKAVKILEVLENTDKNYCIIVMVRLQSNANAYNAKVKINYRLTKDRRWKIEYAYSQGIDLVKTNKYNDCLNFSIEPTGFCFAKVLEITNKTGMELWCAGAVKNTSDNWEKFSVTINPYETKKIEAIGEVVNYTIKFIEKAEKP